jgi:hypothetical protein
VTTSAAATFTGLATAPPLDRGPRRLARRHSHEHALQRARLAGEPAGQIASRELEIQRITGALRRADELTDDVAAVLEAVA